MLFSINSARNFIMLREIEMLKCGCLVLVDSLKHSGYLFDTSQLCLMKYSIIQVVPKLNPVVLHILLYMFPNCMSYILNELLQFL